MPSAPACYIDAGGVLNWTNPGSPPANWYAELRLPGMSTSTQFENAASVSGASNFVDLFAANFPGNCPVVLFGTDANSNVTFTPTVAAGLTRDL